MTCSLSLNVCLEFCDVVVQEIASIHYFKVSYGNYHGICMIIWYGHHVNGVLEF